MSFALRALKLGTRDLHLAADRHLHILDDTATVATYRRYLSRMLGFHTPMEDRFARHTPLAALGFDALARRKQHLLRADLGRLGVHGEEVYCVDLPDVAPVARAIGAAYVLEGSLLGGAFILSRMRPNLGQLIGVATTFLEGYGPSTGPLWRRFAEIAEKVLAAPEAQHRAVDAARDTFRRLITWLDEPAADPPQPMHSQAVS